MNETILGILFVFIMLAFFFMLGMHNSSKSQEESQRFTYEKAEWQWNSVEEDYCKINNIAKELLTPEDEDKIYEYCGMHMAYFLNWAIRNDFLSKGQRKEKELFEKIKQEKRMLVDFLKR